MHIWIVMCPTQLKNKFPWIIQNLVDSKTFISLGKINESSIIITQPRTKAKPHLEESAKQRYIGGVSPTLISVKSMPLGVFRATSQTHVIETNQSGK